MLEQDKIKQYIKLAKTEGWEADPDKGIIYTPTKEFPILHPIQIHLRLFRDEKDPMVKFHSMRRAHDFLWPGDVKTWHPWTEDRFIAHCTGYKYIVMAGGSALGKSLDAAKIGLLFWLSNPKRNTLLVASTTLESLESRIYGYVAKLASSMAIPMPIKIMTGKPPKILLPKQTDKIHGIFAVAIREGQDDKVLGSLIGRHPDYGFMVILDESTDMNPAITKSFVNLEKGVEFFQAWAIGNSKSKNDLHGSLATPKKGWDSVNPEVDRVWPTTHENSICMYFSPYDSPAITEKDPVKKALLSKFLITKEEFEKAKERYGEGSDSYYRFVLGFWKTSNLENTIISEEFAAKKQLYKGVLWSGSHSKIMVAGLDPAFAIGGVGCCLRLATLGQRADGLIVLDFGGDELLHKIEMVADVDNPGELQLAQQVVKILKANGCPIRNMCMDATGVGRALGELIRIVGDEPIGPYRIVSRRPTQGKANGKTVQSEPHMSVLAASDMWMTLRNFIDHDQIHGLDHTTIEQVTSRLVTVQNDKTVIETKRDYISRMTAINPRLASSPDEADAAILCLQAAIITQGFVIGQRRELSNRIDPKSSLFQQKAFAAARAAEIQRETSTRSSRPLLVSNFKSDMVKLVPNHHKHRRP